MNAETLKELLANATPGRRVQFHPDYCPEAKGTPFIDWDMSHDTSVILPDGTRYRGYAHHKHARDAALDALAPQLAADNIALQAEVERLREEHASWGPIMNQRGIQVTKLEAENARLRDALQAIYHGDDSPDGMQGDIARSALNATPDTAAVLPG